MIFFSKGMIFCNSLLLKSNNRVTKNEKVTESNKKRKEYQKETVRLKVHKIKDFSPFH
jgi:hypothetical protein